MTGKEEIKLSLRRPVKIAKWKVDDGTIVYDGRVLLLYEEGDGFSTTVDAVKPGTSRISKLKSKSVGTVNKLLKKEGEIVNPGEAIMEILVGCPHPTVINDLCAECGADLQKDGQNHSDATIPMIHSIPELKVSHELAQQIGRADTERLLKDRKLVLLVDLDQTLIHTTHDNIPYNLKGVHHFQLLGPKSPWYHTRLRPRTFEFLRTVSKLYELHICTFGVRPYAHTIARILDPDGSLFGSRILSRDECFHSDSKFANLQALFPCGDELVCIIDDREDVWNYSPNLIQVKPYHFFRNTGDIHDPNLPPAHPINTTNYLAQGVRVKSKITESSNETSPPPVAPKTPPPPSSENNTSVEQSEKESKNGEITQTSDPSSPEVAETTKSEESIGGKGVKCEEDDKDDKGSDGQTEKLEDGMIEVEDEDDYLMYLEPILLRIHQKFYEIFDKSADTKAEVKEAIAQVRRSVLQGCSLVFSGLVPLKVPLYESGAGILGVRLGAKIQEEITKETTHLVAAAKGTVKVHQAKKLKSVKIVSPHWLMTCAHRWEKVDERLFEVGSGGPWPFCKGSSPTPSGSRPIKDLPPLLTLTKEDMDAMELEVNEEDSEGEEDITVGEGGDEEDEEKEMGSDDEEDSQNAMNVTSRDISSSEGDEDGQMDDTGEEWSQLGAEIEKGLSDLS